MLKPIHEIVKETTKEVMDLKLVCINLEFGSSRNCELFINIFGDQNIIYAFKNFLVGTIWLTDT